MSVARIPIRFDPWYATLSSGLGLPPSASEIEVGDVTVTVRMGWAFRTAFPRAAVRLIEPWGSSVVSRGVHGFAGRWLVNGSSLGVLALHLEPAQKARVLGFPVRVQTLLVSVDEPDRLVNLLSPAPPLECFQLGLFRLQGFRARRSP